MTSNLDLDSKEHSDVEAGLGEKSSLHDYDVAATPGSPKAPGTPPLNPREGMAAWRWPLSVVSLCTAAVLYGLDTTIAADVQGSVYEALGEIQNLPWVGLGFPMASVAVILLWGRLYGLYDVKWLTIAAIVIFEIGSAICGAANNMTALIFGRVIAGTGGAGMYLGALTYFSVFATNTEAALLNALCGFSWGVGAILGPLVGGGFSDSSATWRWAFYINLPLAALFAPVYLIVMPGKNPHPELSFRQKLGELDLVGAVLNGATFVLFMVVVSFSGSTYAWGSGSDIALWVVFGVVLLAYIFQQVFCIFTTKEKRIFPVHFLKSRTLLVLYLATAGASAAMSVTLYYIPLFFQFTRGDSSLEAAVRLLPFMILMIFAVMLSGATLPVVGRYSLYYIFGGACLLSGTAAMFTINTNTPTAHIYGYEILVAFGAGFVFQNAYAIAAAKVPLHDRPNAIGFVNVAQIGTMAIALAIAGCLFQNLGFIKLKHAFAGSGLPDDYIRSALAGTISPIFSSNDQATVHTAVIVVADTIRKVLAVPLSGAALLFVCSFLLPHEKIALDVVAGG